MRIRTIVDTGPLVAYLRHNDQYHAWTRDTLAVLQPPFCTCEPVIAEACFLLERGGGDPNDLLDLVDRRMIIVAFDLSDNIKRIRKLIAKYRSLPMSLADACLVLLSEQHDDARVLTLDSHFRIYRRAGRHVIPVLMPDSH